MDTSKIITVSCPTHHKVLTDGLWNYLNTKHKVDFKIACHKDSIEAHKIILELFSSGSENDWGSQGQAAQHLGDLKSIVEFVYRGMVSFPHDRLQSVLKTAKTLQVHLLVEAIERVSDSPKIDDDPSSTGHQYLNHNQEVVGHEYICKRKGKPMKINKTRLVDDTLERAGQVQENNDCTMENCNSSRTRGRPPRAKLPCVQRVTRNSQSRAKLTASTNKISCQSVGATSTSKKNIAEPEKQGPSDDQFIVTNDWVSSDEASRCSESPSRDSSASESANSWTPVTSTNKFRLAQRLVTKMKKNGGRTPKKSHIQSTSKTCKPPKTSGEGDQVTASRAEYKKLWRKNRPILKCPQCPYETRDKLRYKVHQAKHDPTLVIFKCETCGATFQSKESLDRHQLSHLGTQEIYRCPQCPYSSYKKINYHRHITAIHKIAADGKPLQDKYKCTECQFMCMYKSQFTLHVKMKHSLEKNFKCPHANCIYSSIRKGDLSKHYNTVHLHVRAYMCETCGHKSTHQGALNRHKISHSNEKNYKCSLCDARYGHADQLKNHMQRHVNDDKPFVCQLCAHSCRRRDNLQMHMKRIHKTTLDNQVIQ